MKNVFFILSTARCRSTWFSNLFTYKDSFCYNEELRYITDWSELKEKIEQRPETNVGFEDPELLHYIETLYKRFPDAKYILLERSRDQAEQSLINISGADPELIYKKFDRWYKDIEKFNELVKHYEFIHWDNMDNLNEIKRIWNYVLPNCDFDQQRWEMLAAMRISVTDGNKPYPIKDDCLSPYFNFNKLKKAK
mgnify:CR=1 FL=1